MFNIQPSFSVYSITTSPKNSIYSQNNDKESTMHERDTFINITELYRTGDTPKGYQSNSSDIQMVVMRLKAATELHQFATIYITSGKHWDTPGLNI